MTKEEKIQALKNAVVCIRTAAHPKWSFEQIESAIRPLEAIIRELEAEQPGE